MNISIFGLGYVGCVGMGCLAKQGHHVIGVDVAQDKVDLINRGIPTIVEKDIDALIADGVKAKLIEATTDYRHAVQNSSISFICVGTPSAENGHLNLDYIFQTANQIGDALKDADHFHVVVIRSTVFPGTNVKVSQIIAQQTGKRANVDFAVVSNPEFLREGTAVNDYLNPPLTVLGSACPQAIELMRELYSFQSAPVEVVDIPVAEMIKYVNNTYHALKVVFANEVGAICKQLDIDSHEVMRIFCMDKQLNISPYYFRPGFAYGGSCLPKDLRGLQTLAHDLYQSAPVINSIHQSNEQHIQQFVRDVEKLGKRKVCVLGLSFKAGTDDMRNSPIVSVIETLHGHGYDIKIYDKNVLLSRLVGKNKSMIAERLPHLNVLLTEDAQGAVDWADVVIIANADNDFAKLSFNNNQHIFDLVRLKQLEQLPNYHGLCW